MRRAIVFVVISLLAGVGGTVGTPLSPGQTNTLTTIDEVPSYDQLVASLGSGSSADAVANLAAAASESSNGISVRLRAIHSLVTICQLPNTCDGTSAAHAALVNIIKDPTYATAPNGSSVLILRAAIESLGQLKVSTDVTDLTGFLDHGSRDVRATTAFALRDLCNSNANGPLRTRLQHEATAQVQLAISAALRALSQSPCI